MQIWLDTTDLKTIQQAHSLEILYGVTTNPTLLSQTAKPLEPLFLEIFDCLEGPVAAQVTAVTKEEMLFQAHQLMKFSARFIIKIPALGEGFAVMKELVEEGVPVMATAIFTPEQAYLALKLGVRYIAPYLGRIGDEKKDPGELLHLIAEMKKAYGFEGKVLAAGIRSLDLFKLALKHQTDAATLPKEVYDAWIAGPEGTHKALATFHEHAAKIQTALF